jgi:hypothetical protein
LTAGRWLDRKSCQRFADHFRFAKEVADIARGCSDSLEINSEKKQEWEPRKAA